MEREFDIIIWGATGFTGGLVAEYLCTNYGIDKSVRWTIAGRSEKKLAAVQQRLVDIDPEAHSLEYILADSFDGQSLREMSSRTTVICTTVGPYFQYGAELVSACVETATQYCDLTGESPFIRDVIDQHHETAREKKIKLVHACGYDSIPSDLGVLFVQQAMHKRYGTYANEVRFYTGPTKGGLSGGTFASMMGMLERASDKRIRRILGNPYALNPKDGYKGPDRRDQTTLRFDRKGNKWTAPFVMAGTNTRIVRRSHALQAYEYGETFKYSEVMGFSQGFRGWRKAAMITTQLGVFITLMLQPWTRGFIQRRWLPKPGEGPNKEARDNGYFTVNFLAMNDDSRLWAKIKDNLDPGYGSTAKMLSEAALALALQSEELPKQYGSVTPAVAIGVPLIERLQKAGMIFEITEEK